MIELFIDIETYSEVDLRRTGVYPYAEHPSTQITLVQWAEGDDEPQVEQCVDDTLTQLRPPAEVEAALLDPSITLVAHNASFERTLIRHVWGIDTPPERWLCTRAQAVAHALPAGLSSLCGALDLDEAAAKDVEGGKLIQVLCKPNGKGERRSHLTHPDKWELFQDYARQDIVALREVYRAMPTVNFAPGCPEHAVWCQDQRVNDAGIPVDLGLCRAAVAAAARYVASADEEIAALTGVSSASRVGALREWLADNGLALPDLTADTIRLTLMRDDLPPAARRVLELRQLASKTSTAKYKSVLEAVCQDGRLRGTTVYGGAARTLRWAGRLLQPQNMPRPSRDYTSEEYESLVDSIKLDALEIL